jgi:hypothetical protein
MEKFAFIIVIQNIKNPNLILSGGIENKYKGAYEKIFEILNEDFVYVDFESEEEELIGDDLYLCFNLTPDLDKLERILKIPNVAIISQRYAQGGLVAPNGKRSNLTPKQYKLVRSEAFLNWFGDWINDPDNASKVIDENGEPLVVYHGTNNNFTEFNLERVGSNVDYGMWGSGFYFSPSKSFSKHYGNKILKLFLNIRNPFVRNPNLQGSKSQFKPVYGREESLDLRNKILSYNYDGVFQYNSGEKNALTQIVAFEPNQIKLADETNTDFDDNNPDIRFKSGGRLFNDKDLLTKWKRGESIGFTGIAHLKAKGLIPRADGVKRKSEKYMEDGGLIAPNGKQSNLNAEQYELARSRPFLNWFGDWINDPDNASKIVDENGEPLVCYHGTNREFNVFRNDVGTAHDMGFYGRGFYFTFNPDGKWMKYAIGEAEYYGSIVKGYFINSRKPFDFSELSSYEGVKIGYVGTETMVFLYNIALKFPEISDTIFVDKTTWKNGEGEVSSVPISVLPKLVKKYKKDLKIETIYDDGKESHITGYVKSEIEDYDYTQYGGTKGSYESPEFLGRYDLRLKKQEIEIMLIFEAIEKYEGISSNYYPEGIMTRNPQITQAIKDKNFDSILQTKDGDELVVFNANQIKIADGTNSLFDRNNDDVRYLKGGRTIAQTPSPKKDRIYGSDLNKSNSSKDLSSAKLIKFDENTIDIIKNKVSKHNEDYPNKKINLASAKAVVRRGMGAYSKSHRPTITNGKPNSRLAWGLARLNAFMYKIVNGKSKSGKYHQDDDLIEELGYKVAKYKDGGEMNQEIKCRNCGWEWNTKDSEDFDKYICHHCGFDNQSYYSSDPINKKSDGGKITKTVNVPEYLKMFLGQ